MSRRYTGSARRGDLLVVKLLFTFKAKGHWFKGSVSLIYRELSDGWTKSGLLNVRDNAEATAEQQLLSQKSRRETAHNVIASCATCKAKSRAKGKSNKIINCVCIQIHLT